MNNKILVLLPTLNELENIKILIKQIKNLRIKIDLLFIDDNSNDGTQELIKILKDKNSNIQYIFNKSRLGIGKAHKTGLFYALQNNYHYIITMDSDLAHHPNYIKKILNKKNSAA
jgi:dolichol-phosphate mannosyltransferase